ncbi:PQQ-like beta-propeller repeat protein [Yinghuangia soli]|uniref:PQQ-like beta-propeller repeat protein n=1 Tax=Yinghuangia soli TaxID=2908204 RepID=A0AA41U103_9ACTN|nr:PQQ-like beta-propeller repeat protein [Yinghuangia soli]MCF2526982.1 PQQ-like beta-propeller repeat protein [Yinghuangia soli]
MSGRVEAYVRLLQEPLSMPKPSDSSAAPTSFDSSGAPTSSAASDGTASLTVRRVLASRPYVEIGGPSLAVRDDRSGLVAVAGGGSGLQWPGRDAPGNRSGYRIGVYGPDGRCHHRVRTRWAVQAMAVHPVLPLLAIGTGGWYHEGELLILDLESGAVAAMFDGARSVPGLRWLDARSLEVRLATDDEESAADPDFTDLREVLERDDWTQVGDGEVPVADLPYGPPEFVPLDPPASSAGELTRLRAEIDAAGPVRGAVWAVEALPDGALLATRHGTNVECWDPDGTLRWTVPGGDGGRELLLAPDGESVWVNLTTRKVWGFSGWEDLPYPADRIAVRDGAVLETLDPGFPYVATMRTDGWLALRDCRVWVDEPTETVLVAPDREGRSGAASRVAARVQVGEYSLFAHHFPVRRAPELLFLQGEGEQGTLRKRVVAVDPPAVEGAAATVRRLFALEWDDARDGSLSGGPAVYVEDERGGGLVHAGTVFEAQGRSVDSAFVVRRALPDGEPAWVFCADAAPAAMDIDAEGGTVYVAFDSGEIVALDARDGSVRARGGLRIDGYLADPLSLAVVGPGRIAVGMVDGRIAECSF